MQQSKNKSVTYFLGVPFKNFGDKNESLILLSDLNRIICENLHANLLSYVSENSKMQIEFDYGEEWAVDQNGIIELLVACDCDRCRYFLSKTYI